MWRGGGGGREGQREKKGALWEKARLQQRMVSMHPPLGCRSSTLPLHHSAASVTTKSLIPKVVEKTPKAAMGTAKWLTQAQCKPSILKPYKVTFAMGSPLTLTILKLSGEKQIKFETKVHNLTQVELQSLLQELIQ